MTPSVTEDQVAIALRTFLLALLPSGVAVVQGQTNRVAEPDADDFVVFTVMHDTRLSTTVNAYDAIATATRTTSFQTTYQLDIHGPNSTDNSRVIKSLWRSDYAVDVTDRATFTPLYASDGAQRPFINGEEQYEDRWVLSVEMQINPSVSTPQQFADSVDVSFFPTPGA